MARAVINDISINYEIFGSEGLWIALSPGSRHPYGDFVSIAKRLSAAGYRVLLHDRRNCGASDVGFSGDGSETDIWADDLHALLGQLGALPTIIGGSSAGCRLALIFALRHPDAVTALLLWRITGGAFAAKELAEEYYGQYIALATQGGMQAVCDSPHFSDRIRARPSNRERLMALDPQFFIGAMTRWRNGFLAGANMPVIGATEEAPRSIEQPACLIPGNDLIHNPAAGENLRRLLPRSELHHVVQRRDDDLLREWNKPEWDSKEPEVAGIFLEFLARVQSDRR